MKKKALSLALALALCLGLTVPAFAAEYASTTVYCGSTNAKVVFDALKWSVPTTIKIRYEIYSGTWDDTGYHEVATGDWTDSELDSEIVGILRSGSNMSISKSTKFPDSEDGIYLIKYFIWDRNIQRYVEYSAPWEMFRGDLVNDMFIVKDESGKTVTADMVCFTDAEYEGGGAFYFVLEGAPGSENFAVNTPTQPQQPAGTKTANPTNDKLAVNGTAQTPTVYKIGGSNYFKIRDVAAVLNGTEKQFSVGYSGGKVTVASGQPYAPNGKELKGAPTSSKSATRSNDTIIINGAETDVTVYKIGGSNYFKLRDLGKALDFYVGYSGGQVSIDTSRSYGE